MQRIPSRITFKYELPIQSKKSAGVLLGNIIVGSVRSRHERLSGKVGGCGGGGVWGGRFK